MKQKTMIRTLKTAGAAAALFAIVNIAGFNGLSYISTKQELNSTRPTEEADRKYLEVVDEYKESGVIGKSLFFGSYAAAKDFKGEQSSRPGFYRRGFFEGKPVEIGVNENGERYMRMWSDEMGNRGYKPATLFARDDNPNNRGFEKILLSDSIDLGKTSEKKVNPLERFNDPMQCEEIFNSLADK